MKMKLHNQMININNEKMSKSLGNVIWAKDLIKELGCNVYKWFMLSSHYRNPLNMTNEIIEGVKKERLGTAIMNRLIRACSHNYI